MRDRLPALIVAALGFALYSCTSYPFPDWLDSPEFITAAFRLGGFHPPGSPLAVIAGNLFSLWPFSPPSVSLLWFSAVFAAGALYVLARCVQDLWRFLGPERPVVGKIVAFAATSAFALSPGLWSQAVRTEVYTLAFFLFSLALREFLAVVLSGDFENLERRGVRVSRFCR